MKQYINSLIKALQEFEKNDKLTEFEGLTKEEFKTLAILVIKNFPKYSGYGEEDLRENFTLENYEAILKEYELYLESSGEDVPENLKTLVENFEKYQKQKSSVIKQELENEIQKLRE